MAKITSLGGRSRKSGKSAAKRAEVPECKVLKAKPKPKMREPRIERTTTPEELAQWMMELPAISELIH